MKQAALSRQVYVILVVEPIGGRVERGQVRVAAGERTVGLPLGGEGGVNVGFVVDASSEELTIGHADGVCAREDGHLVGGKAHVTEHRDKRREARAWPWKVAVCSALARRP